VKNPAAAVATDAPAAGALRVLVVDDEQSMRDMLRIVLRRDGYEVTVARNGTEAVETLRREPFDLLLSDIRMPDRSGVEVLRAAKEVNHDIVAIMMTAFASTDTAVEALRLGANDYFIKPFSMDELRLKVRHHLDARRLREENARLKRALGAPDEFCNIVGSSEAMLAIFRMVETIGRTNSTVLITGESGTGKDLVARAIHFHSLRRDQPFVALNCGAVPETLLESELFGHVRGAFTGADANKKGLIEVAERGTIFLDEIGETNATMQVKLLRVLQDRKFRRLGGTEEVQADIRVIAATNQDLQKLVAAGKFREDLYYRINVIPIHLPPLRERREDIRPIAAHFLARFSAQMEKPVHAITAEAMQLLEAYPWPGNVRELENVIERAVALEQTAAVLPETLPEPVRRGITGGPAAPMLPPLPEEGIDLEARVEEIYRDQIAQALKRAGGVQVKAAELLGMSFRSFRYYAKKFNIR
jgi:two-component system response regulator PilR (NtrC family)